jgi:hypothetical protein
MKLLYNYKIANMGDWIQNETSYMLGVVAYPVADAKYRLRSVDGYDKT